MQKTTTPETPNKPEAAKPAAATGFDMQNFAESGQRSFAAIAQMHSRAFNEAMKFNAELADFAGRRIGANLETSGKLSRCKNVAEAFDVFNGHCQHALEEYARESAALMKIGTDMAAEATSGATPGDEKAGAK